MTHELKLCTKVSVKFDIISMHNLFNLLNSLHMSLVYTVCLVRAAGLSVKKMYLLALYLY